MFTLNAVVYHVSGCSPLSPFSKKKDVTATVTATATATATVPCQICPQTFPTQVQLSRHIVSQHTNTPLLCGYPDCGLSFKKSKALKTHHVRTHMDKESLFVKLADKSCKCISCDGVFTANTVVYHVASCSNLSPFCDNDALCHYIPQEDDMVLNQADFLQTLPDIEPDELDELLRFVDETDKDDEFEDIPSDIDDELRQMYA
jgi:hypothetical protein